MDGLEMATERWVEQRMDTLRMKNVLMQNGDRLPPKLERRMLSFDPNERNSRGETLLIGVVRYLTDVITQVSGRIFDADGGNWSQIRYTNMLLRCGCDPSLSETRHKRTPLMFACMERNESLTRLLISQVGHRSPDGANLFLEKHRLDRTRSPWQHRAYVRHD
jgi:hypothetical protein